MWRITIHRLRALGESSTAADIWQAGTLHLVLHAPWSRGGASRMTFKPAADDFGESLVLILDYAGPAITTFMTLKNAEASLRGPVRAALDVTGQASDSSLRNTWRDIFYDGFFDELPPALKFIDQQQRDILTRMSVSNAPVHVIHALAGCGKSTVLQCLVALFAAHHAALSDSEAGSQVLVFILRTRTLRHEFLQTLMRNQVLKPEQVIFGGRLPDRFLEAGVLDDDAAHFQKIVLLLPEPSRLLLEYETALAALMARHEDSLRTHAVDASWAQVGEVVELKRLAKHALAKLWSFHEAYSEAEAACLRRVAVLLVTTDVALKIFGRAATPGSPAAKLMKQKQSSSLILDEMQRCPVETFCALGSRHDTVVAVGDRGQEIYPAMPSGRNVAALPTQTFVQQARPTFAAESLLARASAAPGAPDSPIVYHLTETKRFGNPLATYLAHAHPELCADLSACPALGKETPVTHVWYKAPCPSWYNLGFFLGGARKKPFRDTSAWQLSAATWNDGLFSLLAACVLTLLQQEAHKRRALNIGFAEDELVVVVCAAIRRVVGPFQVVLNALLNDANVRAQFDLEEVLPDHVQVRLPGDLTGPSASYVIVVRHPRFRGQSQIEWKDGDLQHHGRQTIDELNYIMESRPELGLYIFMHDQPPPDASTSSRADPSGWRDILGKQALEAKQELQIIRHEVDCERLAGQPPLVTGAISWQDALGLVSRFVRHHRQHSHDAVVKATGLLGDGDEESHAPTLLDTLRDLGSQDLVEESGLEAKRRGEARNECPMPLADFGRRAWPRDPAQVCQEDFAPNALHGLMVELGWRMVDFVAVQVQGKTAFQVSVPLLDPLAGYDSPNYSTWGSAAPGAPSPQPSLLTAFVLCVWAVYKATCPPPHAQSYAMMSVHHKASVTEGGGDQGVTWWTRACNTDREAIILLKAEDAETLLQNADRYRRPPKPRAPPLYCYIGMGVDRQPECITGMVVRTKSVELTAAVCVACRILGRFFPGDVPVDVTADRIAIGEEPWEKDAMQALVSHISSMWVPWGDVLRDNTWDRLADTFRGQPPVWLALPPDQATADRTAIRVLEMVVEPDEPDWGDDDDVEEIIPAIPVPKAVPRPPAQPSRRPVRLGVDLGGVLLAKLPSGQLPTVQTTNDIGIKMGYVHGAVDWFTACVANYGEENVFVISYVQSRRLRELFSDFLFASDGLLNAAGIPKANLIWTDSRSDKCWPFVLHDLTHFIDDQVEVLVSIRDACWKRRPHRPPPALFLVPTAWAHGKFSDFGRTCSDAARANEDWEEAWHIYPQSTVSRVCPWDWATVGGR